MKIALYQGPSPEGAAEVAFGVITRMLGAAAAAGAHMAVFPEVFLPGYNRPGIADAAQPLGGPWCVRLSAMAAAAGCGVTVGFAERDGAAVYNAAVAYGADGALLAHYRKVQLYGPRENSIYTPGNRLCTFDLDGHRAALLICYDIEFAPHVRALAEGGVTLILVPTANMMPFTHVSRLTVPSHAVNHAVSIVYANYSGTEGDLTYCGGSVIVGPDGAILASAGTGEALLIADLGIAPPDAELSAQLRDYRAVE